MKINLVNVDRVIKTDGLLPVKDPVYFSMQGEPTEDGLFSTKIFGNMGSSDRKNRFGYIELHGHFIQPIMCKVLSSMDKNIDKCINGQGFYSVNELGELVPDEVNGGTGIEYLYSIYKKLRFYGRDSEIRKSKAAILANYSREEVFTERFLIIPAFLRDFNPSSSGRIADVDEINEMYSKIIRMCSTLGSSSFSFISVATRANVQAELVKIYTYLTESLAHKNGLIHRSLIGKSVDYATRSVITAPRFTSKKWDDQQIRFGYTGIPLAQAAVLFYPFFLKYITDFISDHKKEFTEIHTKNGVIHIDNIEDQFSSSMINKMVDNFIKDEENRFQSIKVHDRSGIEYPVEVYREELGRNFTVTDLLYLAASDICADKHVYVTRYPIENHLNIYPSKITLLTTKNTIEVTLPDKFLKDYPLVLPDYPTSETNWVNSVRINNSYTAALGAD